MGNQIGKKGSLHYFEYFLLFAGLTTSVLGLLGMVDLHFGTHLVRISSLAVPLHYNASIGLLLLGLGTLGSFSPRPHATAFIGMILLSFGLGSIVQIFLKDVFLVEKVFFRTGEIHGSLGAGLSLNASLGFFFGGLAYILKTLRTKLSTTLVFFSGSFLSVVSLLAVLGYLTGFVPGYAWAYTSPLPHVHAIGFFFTGLSLLVTAFLERKNMQGGSTSWLPMQVAAGLSVGLLILFLGLLKEENHKAQVTAERTIETFEDQLEDHIVAQLQVSEKLAKLWLSHSSSQWEEDATTYKKRYPSIESIVFLKSPPKGVPSPQSVQLLTEKSSDVLEHIRFISPLYKSNRLQGYLLISYSTSKLVEFALSVTLHEGLAFRLSINNREVFYKKEASALLGKNHSFEFAETTWSLATHATPNLIKASKSYVPQVVLILGLSFTSLLCFLIYFALNSNEKAALLQKSQAEMFTAKEEALQASKLKSDFLAKMSHEIRTPMNAVLGLTELLKDTSLNSEQREHIDSIKFSAESLLEILNEVLDLAKIEAGKMELENRDFDLKKELGNCVKIFETQAKQKRLRLNYRYSDSTPTVFQGDPYRIRQVVSNFLSNAIKFTDKGEIRLQVTHSEESENQCRIRVEVTDTGIGIPKEKRGLIFESFSQVDSSMSRKYGGTGLGLAISKKLVEQMQGQIDFESTKGKGTAFYFSLTLPFGHLVATPEKRKQATVHGLRILVAEDNTISRRVLAKMLGKVGHLVDTVNDGTEVLRALKQNIEYDLILMDCQMPKMDGYEATREIRIAEAANPSKGRIPIVALTAHALSSDKKRCLDAGMDEYLAKPYKTDDLLAVIESVSPLANYNKKRSKRISAYKPHAGIDLETVRSVIGLNQKRGIEFFEELLGIFSKTTPKSIKTIKSALLKRDLKTVAEISHSLKSSSSNLGATRLFHAARRLELSAKSGSVKGARKNAALLEAELPRTVSQLSTILNEEKEKQIKMAS